MNSPRAEGTVCATWHSSATKKTSQETEENKGINPGSIRLHNCRKELPRYPTDDVSVRNTGRHKIHSPGFPSPSNVWTVQQQSRRKDRFTEGKQRVQCTPSIQVVNKEKDLCGWTSEISRDMESGHQVGDLHLRSFHVMHQSVRREYNAHGSILWQDNRQTNSESLTRTVKSREASSPCKEAHFCFIFLYSSSTEKTISLCFRKLPGQSLRERMTRHPH